MTWRELPTDFCTGAGDSEKLRSTPDYGNQSAVTCQT